MTPIFLLKHGDTVALKEIFTAKKALRLKTNSTEALIQFLLLFFF